MLNILKRYVFTKEQYYEKRDAEISYRAFIVYPVIYIFSGLSGKGKFSRISPFK